MHVIPATGEAEAGESLEPGRRRLHSSLGDKSETQSQNKKRERERKEMKAAERLRPAGAWSKRLQVETYNRPCKALRS